MLRRIKKLFAVVLSLAIIAMSLFTGVIVSAETGTVDVWEYDSNIQGSYDDGYLISERVVGTGTEADPYIISTAEQLASLCAARFKDAGDNVIDTAGKYFKVADGIDAFYMNGGETVANLTSAADVKAWFEDANNTKSQWWAGNKFKGTFDGNGVTVYGIYCTQAQAGLFHKVDGATIKNVTVANSYFSGSEFAGAIAGGIEWVSGDVYGDTAYYNCGVENNYISASTGFAGAVVGQLRNTTVTASNIFVEGNILECTKRSGVFGDSDKVKVENIIAIGTTAWSLDGGWNASHIDTGNYKNIYTDQSLQELTDYAPSQNAQTYIEKFNINQLTVEQMTGAAAKINMPALDWENVWACGSEGEYPTFVKAVFDDKDNTALSWDGNPDKELTLLDPTKDNSESNPYLIENPGQLYALARNECTYNGNAIDTTGKFFKVADGINTFYMNGGQTVANLKSAEEVKAWFEDSSNSKSQWWLGGKFKGNFDGNGITVYGIYSTQSMAGLFPKIDGATIKNVMVANSYFSAANDAGAIVGGVEWVSGDVYGDVTLENCAAVNNYIATTTTDGQYGTGAVIGNLRSAKLSANNILVYGNSVTSTRRTGVFGKPNSLKVTNIVAIGTTPWSFDGGWNASHVDSGNFQNIYTDQSLQELTDYAPSQNAQTYIEKFNINQLTVEQMTGAAAKNNMPALDTEVWLFNTSTYPSLKVFHNIVDGVCDRCGLEVFEDPCANGHTLVSYEEIPATTVAEGKKAYDECSICHKLFIGGVEVTAEQLVIPMIKDYDIWEYDAQIQGSYDDKFIVNNEGDGTEANPYIIHTAEQLASVTAARIKDANGATVDTAGLYFKVDDNVKAFYMNGGKAIAELKSAAEVKAYFEATPGSAWWVSGSFKGTFDGNGATVYGLYATKENAGLFQNLGAGSVIKNIAVKNSYFSASSENAGAIAGQVQWYNGIGDGTQTFENCVSQNNYIAAIGSAGAIFGHSRENKIIMTNCLAADNEFAGEAYLVGNSWNSANSISNTIVIGGLVYGNNGSLKKAEIFSNVYTNVEQTGEGVPEFTADQVTVLTVETMTMDNMSGLDWVNDWAYAGAPELRAFHDFVATDNGDGTHTEACECGLVTAAQKHTFVNGECDICGNKCLHSNVGEAQTENFVDATCVSTGSYDTVTYCADCGNELSRETTTIEINPDAHAFDSDADKDCNNGCGFVRVNYGDSNGDGELNNKDIAAIMQHINGWSVEIDEAAADVNCDGKINNKDYALLMQYVNGWDVSIG